MFYQKYMIHLKGGTQVEVEEPYDLPWEKSLFTMYEKTKESGAIVARNPIVVQLSRHKFNLFIMNRYM